MIYFYFKSYKLLGWRYHSLVDYDPNIHMDFIFNRIKGRKGIGMKGVKGKRQERRGGGDGLLTPKLFFTLSYFNICCVS